MFFLCLRLTHVTPGWTLTHHYFLGPPVNLWVVFLEPAEPKDDVMFPQAGHHKGGALCMPLVAENHIYDLCDGSCFIRASIVDCDAPLMNY